MEQNGLTSEQVKERIAEGKVNVSDKNSQKTVPGIIAENVFTYFNLIFAIITVLLCIVGSFKDLTFLPIIIGNILIGIIQEIRAKKVVDSMKFMSATHAMVMRDGNKTQITSEEVVLDDVMWLSSGDSICADAKVISGEITVNESMLTGESDGIVKHSDDELFSGSFVVSGEGYAVVTKVGNDSYISQLANEAKAMKDGEQSEMIRSIDLFVKVMGIVIIPLALLLFGQAYWIKHESFKTGITSMVASITGLIPEGLYLLTTCALALSMMRLAKKKVLLHDMKSIESLARVDILCVDKTGTITKPEMAVHELIPLTEDIEDDFARYVMASIDNNATGQALKKFINDKFSGFAPRNADRVYPFNSTVKYGCMAMSDINYVLGAPEFILKNSHPDVMNNINDYAQRGYRVLVFGQCETIDEEGIIGGKVTPLALVTLANEIRDNAVKTFKFFKEQGVAIKVISGDNPVTVSEVAKQAGVDHAENYIDASTLTDEKMIAEAIATHTVFGRVTPAQKKEFVKALKAQGHTVAMTGDGVNDILALKEADCSIAMASGAEATAQASHIVLLDSDFSRMPSIVAEGRCVVNNVQRSAGLFLVKNIFSLLLTIFSTILAISYPLTPSQVTFISFFTIGLPGFLLAAEPNHDKIRGKFLTNVFVKSLPGGITDFLAVSALVICGMVFDIPKADMSTCATLIISVVGLIIVYKLCHPLTRYKSIVATLIAVGFVLCGQFLSHLFDLSHLSYVCVLLTIVFAFAAESVFRYLTIMAELINRQYLKYAKRKLLKKLGLDE